MIFRFIQIINKIPGKFEWFGCLAMKLGPLYYKVYFFKKKTKLLLLILPGFLWPAVFDSLNPRILEVIIKLHALQISKNYY